MREQPPSPGALQETDWVAFSSSCRHSLRPLVERRGMHEPSSSHLGVLWSGALGRIPAPIHREQDRYRSRDSLRPCIHYATFATHGGLKCLRLNAVSAATRKMNGARPALSHGLLAVIKWTVCHHRETVFLPEAQRETDAVFSGDEWGGWWMGDALNVTGVERPPWGPFITRAMTSDASISFLAPLLSVFPCHFSHRHGAR
jgi:hypothetical protein